MQVESLSWFPGHMTKTRRMIASEIGHMDAVCEILDARIPLASRNPDVDELTAGKPRLVVLNRVDQADPGQTRRWAAYFREKGYAVLEANAKGELDKTEVKFSDKSACCLVLASQGYPKKYETGYPITIPADLDAEVYVAGAKLDDGVLKTSGGRVLGVSAIGNTLKEAIDKAYREGAKVKFENAYCRKDIGAKALRAEEEVK